MKVAIDLLPITGRNGGLQTYARQLVTSLAKVDPESEYVLLVNARAERLFDVPARNFKLVVVRTPRRFIGLWEQLTLPVSRILRRVDLLHSPVSAPPLRSPCRTVVTVHDLTFKLHPETMQWWDRLCWDALLSRGARRADAVIADSESTKRDILRFLHLDASRVSVVHLCCSVAFYMPVEPARVEDTLSRMRITSPYVLYVGTLEPRKNIPVLLRAFSLVKQRMKCGHSLVVAGGKGWLFQEVFRTVRELGLEQDVVFTGFVPDEDLPALYQGADLFVYPSLYEGFGLPPLEAMASGTPVIVSNRASIPEVVGDAGILVDPNDVETLADAISCVLSDSGLRERLGSAGKERARLFTPDRMAERTRAVYRQVLREGDNRCGSEICSTPPNGERYR